MRTPIIDPETDMGSDELISKEYKDSQQDYELQEHERQSIKEIERMLNNDLYTDENDLRDHLEFLEQIATKLNSILENERQAGITNYSLKQDYIKINRIFTRLTDLLEKF